ncbi:putative transcription factor WRKY family [Rosa chinensis]|uniref:Putative transcription factor WRKY family n=1 Tax=Rosa chinensis TaxID=74649 RepID=A0A2P6RUW5_ROSCH|nr:probable WRKY transcription factor 69 [Rosa chinensis]PRQ50230.1 putative transcription factor WRKY family [Rosa chinensis]
MEEHPKFYRNPVFRDPQDAEPISENDPDSPSSGEETKVTTAPSPKGRRGVQKRVVSVPIGDVEGSKGKGDGYPPFDSWTWRKYGQKPIKGSPYPRGYYRCSFSKACPARKQVERSCSDPRMLMITYACDHNHPMPTTKGSHPAALTTPVTAKSPITEPELPDRVAPSEELTTFSSQVDLELSGNSEALLGDYGCWFNDLGTTTVLESSICVGHSDYVDVDVATRLEHEDEYLFADLGELPESSVIF